MDIHSILLSELGVDDLPPLVELDLDRVCRWVCNYCHIKEIPEALNYTVADMVLDLQKVREGINATITDADMGKTGYSIREDTDINDLLKDYRQDLTRFRRVRW